MPSAKIYILYMLRNYYHMHLVETQFYEAVAGLQPTYKANDIRYTDVSEITLNSIWSFLKVKLP